MKKYFLILLLSTNLLSAQHITPGFDAKEFFDLLSLLAQKNESKTADIVPIPDLYKLAYQSKEIGFDNQWSLWINDKNQAAITIRGSVQSSLSWLSNTYEAMIPASGVLTLSNDLQFPYQLSTDPNAAVHAGWMISTAFLLPDIKSKIDSCYQQGIRDFYIAGHSQGGPISFLITSELRQFQTSGKLAKDIQFKTYASASPKPGNLFYAYEFEKSTQDGWAFSVVNPLDWVPEMPFSIQTTQDFNPLNPFPLIQGLIAEQGLAKKLVLRHFYNQIDKPTKKSQRKMEKLLGKNVFKLIQKQLPELHEPQYFPSNNYVRTGAIRVLIPDEGYYKLFPQDPEKSFTNHDYRAYLYLAQQLYLKQK
ncbi:lipase family protein [Flavobacterium sp. HSC-61S13]|uniref:lipase family protein n=1 Tax=Flavobacterium sp. HSC-61S13 TaxID=2910963 RepID=UPI00209D82FC|nr:lipase family protein [Flavobacterium sp. HSC-61S13]MCP1994759.1 hypothetical protein [Flavobacterium sp. HSC-61S13]